MTYRLALLVLCLPLAACGGMSITRDGVVQGTERFQGGFSEATTTPLEDLNIRRDEIPPILLAARARPYDLTGLGRCPALIAEIDRLDLILGPDVDQPTQRQQLEAQAADAALSAVSDAAGDLIPMRGWVRRLSGAHAHARDVRDAIEAGTARRSYLKGVAHARRCRR